MVGMLFKSAGLIRYYRENKLILINKSPKFIYRIANLVSNDSIGNVFKK